MSSRVSPMLDRRSFLLGGLAIVAAACAGDGGTSSADGPGSRTASDAAPEPTGGRSGRTTTPSSTPVAPAPPSPGPATAAAGDVADEPAVPRLPVGIVPISIAIPAIDVEARVTPLQLRADEAEVPADFDAAGWWVQTREPGAIGPAVIGGHVDSRTGPAVFFRLEDLTVGDEVVVRDDAGQTRTFVVDTVPFRVRKDERPPEVFGFGRPRPELRLITCGGDFDPTTGHYVDNVVVFCHDPTHTA